MKTNRSLQSIALLLVVGTTLPGLPTRGLMAQDSAVVSDSYAYIELVGKGYLSANYDFGLAERTRVTVALTMLDYEYGEQDLDGEWNGDTLPSPGVMIMRLYGSGPKYFELGGGMSISPLPWKDFGRNDSAFSFHGVIGYRYQRKGSTFYRVGLTPFYRVNWLALPLIGLSIGISV